MAKKPNKSENNGDQSALVKFKFYAVKLYCSPASVHITDTKQVRAIPLNKQHVLPLICLNLEM